MPALHGENNETSLKADNKEQVKVVKQKRKADKPQVSKSEVKFSGPWYSAMSSAIHLLSNFSVLLYFLG